MELVRFSSLHLAIQELLAPTSTLEFPFKTYPLLPCRWTHLERPVELFSIEFKAIFLIYIFFQVRKRWFSLYSESKWRLEHLGALGIMGDTAKYSIAVSLYTSSN